MAKTKVLLLGATGETGASILNGLIKNGDFDITLLIRPESTNTPKTLALAKDHPILTLDLSSPIDPIPLRPFNTIISAIGPSSQQSQLYLATAAAAAGISRFIPCGFITICPPMGVMALRDAKEEVYNHILKLKLPYTIIDTGFWHQISFPRLDSGKIDGAIMIPKNDVYGDGSAPNLFTDLRDIGEFVARIIRDPRTLNKKVFTWSDELSQNEIYALVERLSGEKVSRNNISEDDVFKSVADAWKAYAEDESKARYLWMAEYNHSKYVRRDNTRKNALYLGYLDGKELYPDFKPVTFEELFKEVLEGKVKRPYAG